MVLIFLIKSVVIGSGTLYDGLYSVHFQDNNAYNSLSLIAGIKRNVMNEESSLLWHWILGHISIQRIKRLVNEGVFNALYFTNFETFLDCIKGKQTNKSKKGATRSKHLLEIIHTNICCPNMDGSGQNTSSPSLMTTLVTCISTCFVLRMKRWKPLIYLRFK